MRPHRASKRDNTSFGETPQALAILEKFARVIAENRISPPTVSWESHPTKLSFR
jgi:hypothetical protein